MEIFAIVIGLLLAAVGSLIFASLYRRLLPRLAKTRHVWDDTLLYALYPPLIAFIWALLISYLLPASLQQIGVPTISLEEMDKLRQALLILAIFWFSIRFINGIEKVIFSPARLHRIKRDRTSIHAIAQLFRVIVGFIVVLLLLQTFGISITTILAFGGVGGIAIGFAAKDTLANFLGGMMIYWDRPFAVGDWVRSPDREIEGTVENIGWRLTRIRTLDKRLLYVPNGIFSTISLENPSRMSHRRIKQNIGLRYEDAPKLKGIIADIEQMLKEHPEIATDQTLMVCFNEFATSSLNFLVYSFTKTTDGLQYQMVQQDILLKIIDIVMRHKAQFAFPTQTVHIPEPLDIPGLKSFDNQNQLPKNAE